MVNEEEQKRFEVLKPGFSQEEQGRVVLRDRCAAHLGSINPGKQQQTEKIRDPSSQEGFHRTPGHSGGLDTWDKLNTVIKADNAKPTQEESTHFTKSM